MASFTSLAITIPAYIVSVTQFGALPQPGFLNTFAFEAGVADISSKGGGTLYVPPGSWMISPFNFTSNMELLLDANTTLLGSSTFADWPIIAPLPSYGRGRDFPGPRYSPLLRLNNVSNIRIASNATGARSRRSSSENGERGENDRGQGGSEIIGQGQAWWESVRNGTLQLTPGHLLESMWSTDIEITGITFRDSPFWNIHVWDSQRVWAHNFSVFAPSDSTNTDGFDPDSSADVLVEDADIYTGDDCIAIKSGWNEFGIAYGVPCTNITIQRLRCSTPSGCIAIGSEMSGGVSNVYTTAIECYMSSTAFHVKSTLGRGGYVQNITLDGMTLGGQAPSSSSLSSSSSSSPAFSLTPPITIALVVADNYKDQYPPGPINASLIPIIQDIYVYNLSLAAVTNSSTTPVIEQSGDFEGLGTTISTGKITGIVMGNINLGTNISKGYVCANVTGSSNNVFPAPCAALGGQ